MVATPALQRGLPGAALALILAHASPGAAQTDYYNTDAGRPVRIEDAHPTERYAFELQLAPLRLERAPGGLYHWEVEPELAYGILPYTHLEVGFPLLYRDVPGEGVGLGGIEVSALHNLNVETRTLPAFAVAAEALLPVGGYAPERVYPSVKGIATRTFGGSRVHLNAQYTFGSVQEETRLDAAARLSRDVVPPTDGEPAPAPGGPHAEVSRWMAGVAVDRVFPLRSMLLIGEVYAEQPLSPAEERAWNAGAGIRYQWSPRLALDAGVGTRLTGSERPWFVTFGSAYVFAVRSLIPGARR